MWSISRLVGVSINTVTKLLVDVGEACAAYHDEHVRGVRAERVQCVRIWSFAHTKKKSIESVSAYLDSAGDVWTWTALDADHKLIVSWLIGSRNAEDSNAFMLDVADRLANRVRLTTDGRKAYLGAVEGAFGADVDNAQLVRLYGTVPEAARSRNSSAVYIGPHKENVNAKPKREQVITSHVESQNLTTPTSIRRFTGLTNAFSKRVENYYCALALYFVWYNFCKQHKSLAGMSPAMAAGVSDTLHDMKWIVGLIGARVPKRRPGGPQKKANSN